MALRRRHVSDPDDMMICDALNGADAEARYRETHGSYLGGQCRDLPGFVSSPHVNCWTSMQQQVIAEQEVALGRLGDKVRPAEASSRVEGEVADDDLERRLESLAREDEIERLLADLKSRRRVG
jgi:hypothetical protein